jgi:hypothetical protein
VQQGKPGLSRHHRGGRRAPDPVPVEEEDAKNELSEWEQWEWREREEERKQETEGLGAEVEEERPLFLPTPSFMASADEEQESGVAFLCLSFAFLSLSPLLHISLVRSITHGSGLCRGQRGAGSGRETDSLYFAMISRGRMRTMTENKKRTSISCQSLKITRAYLDIYRGRVHFHFFRKRAAAPRSTPSPERGPNIHSSSTVQPR